MGSLARYSLLFALLLSLLPPRLAHAHEAGEGEAVTIVDRRGRIVLETGLDVTPGDQFIDEGNLLWLVRERNGNRAIAEPQGPVSLDLTEREAASLPKALDQAALGKGVDIAVYHTHNAEAYEPTEGHYSVEPEGGIVRVGEVMVEAFRAVGIEAIHETTSHLPHNKLSYSRSRRTAIRLMTQSAPTAMFDLHRDTAPARAYEMEIDGEPVARVMIVVGRANPSMETTLAFAKRVKEQVDEAHPGLMRAIYFGKGHYNQDLFPHLLLLEMGSYKLPREYAERTAVLLAEPLLTVVGLKKGPALRPDMAEENRAAWRSILGWLALASALGGFFFVVTNGGWAPARRKLTSWLQRVRNGRNDTP